MVSDRDKRRLDIEGMPPEEFAAEYQRVFGEGVASSLSDKAVSAILDKEFGAKRKVYFSAKCEYCGEPFPSAATPLEKGSSEQLVGKNRCCFGSWLRAPQESEQQSLGFYCGRFGVGPASSSFHPSGPFAAPGG